MVVQEDKVVTILVIDDDPNIGRLLTRNLENSVTRVINSITGLEGLQALCRKKVDTVFLDISLPDLNGWGILCLLRMTDALRSVPVIIMSAESPGDSPPVGLQPDYYLHKPFGIDELLAHLPKIGTVKGL